VIEAIEANHVAYLADLDRSPLVTLHDDPEVLWFESDAPHPRSNRVLRARFGPGDVDAKIEAALAPFKARAVSAIWHTGPTTQPADLGQRLVAHGLQDGGDEPGMAIDLLTIRAELACPADLTIKQVHGRDELSQWSHTFARGFEITGSAGGAIFTVEASLPPHPHRRLFLGLWNGEPAATSALFLSSGVAGIYCVGTVPELRRRGIGRAMTLAPLLEARALGYRVGTLSASHMGLGLYLRLGFREYCKVGRYVWAGDSGRG
jgi:ribosomal protein S18 acetylase RimI-like enzyme